MKVEIIRTLSDGTIVVKNLDGDKMPEEGKQYTVWFETIEPDPVPEFNQ